MKLRLSFIVVITQLAVFAFCKSVPLSLKRLSEQQAFRETGITSRYQDVADQIREFLTNGEGKGQTYARLENLTDVYGPRYATGTAYKLAARYVMDQLTEIGIDRVWTETVEGIPLWSRGDPNPGQAYLVRPRNKHIAVMALGNSTATPPGGLMAQAIVVTSFDELAALPDDQVKGRIVVYNQPWQGYGASGQYRSKGAIRAAQKGGIAALVRSLTPQSLYTLHTGQKSSPVPGVPDIPVASITVEDAELLYRLQQDGEEIWLTLELNTQYLGTTTSFNIVAELKGSTYPNEIVLFGGHFDSWDVGEGAMDDGGGVAITWQALNTMTQLGLRPKRTVRAVFWTAEEYGYLGADAYYNSHKNEAETFSLVMESDSGTFTPVGVHYAGNKDSQTIMQQVMDLLKPINANLLSVDGGVPGDPGAFVYNDGVPGIELYTENDKYFWYHHSDADTMTMMNSTSLDLCSTVWTTIAYVVADLDALLPHGH